METSNNELQLFHSIDRRLYTVLVIELLCNPYEVLPVMALWIWLEKENFENIVQKILGLPPILILELVDEALICLNIINDSKPLLPFEAFNISLTQSLLKQDFSLQYLQDNQNRVRVSFGVDRVHKEICKKVFRDITEDAIARNEAAKRLATENQQMLLQQQQFDPIGFNTRQLNNNRVMSAEERTMFVTFSRGYPVAECEVRDFFTNMYGNCIESFYMQDVRPGDEQALFARIVFYSHDIIDMILSGEPKAKFIINGKHVWMRKFVPKRPRTVPTQRPHPNHSSVVKLPVSM